MYTGKTYGEAAQKMNDAMIDECTRKIRAAGISEAEEQRILARGYGIDSKSGRLRIMPILFLLFCAGLILLWFLSHDFFEL